MSEDLPTSPEQEPTAPTGGPRRSFLRVLGQRSDRLNNVGIIVLSLLVVLLFGAVGYGSFNRRLDAARNADTATILIEKADKVVVEVDKVIRSEITSNLAEPARMAAGKVPAATASLERAIELLDATGGPTTLDQEKRTDLLKRAAVARLEMMKQAPTILRLNQGAAEALTPARQGWDAVVAADKKSDEAVAEYNRLTKRGVSRSNELNKQVSTDLAGARTYFEQAERLFPEGAFETYIAYIDARIGLNSLSRQSDSAWLKGDTDKANSLTTSYNSQDAEAIRLAKALPATPEKAIADAFEAAAQRPMESYYRSRDAATDADKELRR